MGTVQSPAPPEIPARSVWYLPESRGLGNVTASAYLRLIGVAAIVWFHANPTGPLSSAIGGMGLAVFTYLSFLHAGRRGGHGAAIKRLTKRLLAPWAAWWLIYAAARFWMARGVPPALTSIAEVLAWPSPHLWYLPFVFFGSLGLLGVSRVLAPIRVQIRVLLALVAALGLLSLMVAAKGMPFPLGIVILASPAMGLGLVYGYCMRINDQRRRLECFVAIAALVAAACIPLWFAGARIIATAYTGGSFLMILAALSLPRSRPMMHLSALTMGIYLCHPLVFWLLYKFFRTDIAQGVYALAMLVLSALATWVIRQNRYLRAIV